MKTKSIRRSSFILFMCILMMLTSFQLLLSHIRIKTYLAAANLIEETVPVSNSNFEDGITSNTSLPADVSGWTVISGYSKEAVKTGVISTDTKGSNAFEAKHTDYLLGSGDNPTSPYEDKNVLMINAKSDAANFGYESSVMTLSPNSFYRITVWTRTLNDATMSIYLADENEDNPLIETLSFTSMQRYWKKHNFYVTTSIAASSQVHLELWLGSRNNKSTGAVFFDSVSCTRLDEVSYNTEISLKQQNDTEALRIFSVREGNQIDLISNGSFNSANHDGLEGWEEDHTATAESAGSFNITTVTHDFNNLEDVRSPGKATGSGSDKALFLYSSYQNKLSYKSTEFTISQQIIYRIGVYVKSGFASFGSVNLNVIAFEKNGEEIDFEDEPLPTSTHTVSSANEWVEYVFFVKGHINYDAKMQLVLTLDVPENNKDYIFFTDINSEKVTFTEYEEGKTGSYSQEFMLHETGASSVENGYFNNAEKVEWKEDSFDIMYPLKPSSWSQNSVDNSFLEETDALNGIIDTNTVHFNAQKEKEFYKGFDNPGLTKEQIDRNAQTATNNILMIGNLRETSQSYVSQSKTFETGSTYKISFSVKTAIEGQGAAYVFIKSGNSVLASKKDITNASTSNNWQTYDLYIETGILAYEVTIELWLGREDAYAKGFVFFDNIEFEQIEDPTTLSADTNILKLSHESFTEVTAIPNKLASFTSSRWTGTIVQGGTLGATEATIISVANTLNLQNDFGGLVNPGKPNDTAINHMLMIKSPTPTEYIYSSNTEYSVISGEYYRFSVWVKTAGIVQGFKTDEDGNYLDEDGKITENPDEYVIDEDMGAKVAFSEFDTCFTGVITTEWEQYTFLVRATETRTFRLHLGLGSGGTSLTAGYAFFSSIAAEKITVSEFTSESEKPENITSGRFIKIGNTDTPGDTQPKPTNPKGNFDWLWIPSLATLASLLIVMGSVAFKKVKFKKKVKVVSEYDKNYIENQEMKEERRKTFIEKLKNFFSFTKQSPVVPEINPEAEKPQAEQKPKEDTKTNKNEK